MAYQHPEMIFVELFTEDGMNDEAAFHDLVDGDGFAMTLAVAWVKKMCAEGRGTHGILRSSNDTLLDVILPKNLN